MRILSASLVPAKLYLRAKYRVIAIDWGQLDIAIDIIRQIGEVQSESPFLIRQPVFPLIHGVQFVLVLHSRMGQHGPDGLCQLYN